MRRARVVLAVVAGFVLTLPVAPAAAGQTYDRIYLLADGDGGMHWGLDAKTPTAPMSSITRTCGAGTNGRGDRKPCGPAGVLRSGTNVFLQHSIEFAPAAIFDGPVEWSESAPLRFHIEADIEAAAPTTVYVGLNEGGSYFETEATAVAPGVYEGALTTGSPLPLRGKYTEILLRVRTLAPSVNVTIGTRGRSYVQLPSAVPGRSLDELLSVPQPSATSSFETATRSLEFNDGEWSIASFTGDLSTTRTFGIDSTRHARFVVAWVEAWGTPFAYDAVRDQAVNPAKITDSPSARLLWDGKELQHTGNGNGPRGRGQDQIAAISVPPGRVELEVGALTGATGASYTAHILSVYGARTVRSVRWQFMLPYLEPAVPHRSPVSSACPNLPDAFAVSEEVTTFSVEVDWESVNPTAQRWVPRWGTPSGFVSGCGEDWTADRAQVVYPGPYVWYFGVGLGHDATFFSARDTRFEMEVRFTYGPAV